MKPKRLEPDVAAQLRRISAKAGNDLARFPDFMLLGPPRTGSSWLFRRLATHPEIFLPREKETYFFSTLGEPDNPKRRYPALSDYLNGAMVDAPLYRLRKQVRNGLRYAPRIYGEATASNATLTPEVIREIRLINPEIKALIMLRKPEERARSHAKKALTAHTGRRPGEVEFEEFDRFLRARGQLGMANYREMIDRWRGGLKPGNFMITEFRRVSEDPQQLLRKVQKFLGVDHERLPGLRQLQAKVYSTGAGRLPDRVEARIQELYGPAIRDFDLLLGELKSAEIADGCYRL